MIYIYALYLENDKYYIGKTTNPAFRISDHVNSIGSKWTQKYKPIELLEINFNCNPFDEDKYTLMYMNKFGIDNVRGGSFATIHLDKATKRVIERMINNATDKCFKCGKNNHFAKDCSVKKKYESSDESEYDSDDEESEYESSVESSSESSSESDDSNDPDYELFHCEYCDREYDSEVECFKHEDRCYKNPSNKKKN